MAYATVIKQENTKKLLSKACAPVSFACNCFGVLCFVTRLIPRVTFYDKSAFIFDLNASEANNPITVALAITIIIGIMKISAPKSSFMAERADLVQ